ncbi:hypothetical protein M2149_000959 [Lachnospiraceae bacterium PFB1-21]
MERLSFGLLVKEIKDKMKESPANEEVVGLLFDAIVIPLGLKSKTGEPFYVDKGATSKLINNTAQIPKIIRDGIAKKDVEKNINKYFENFVAVHMIAEYKKDFVDVLKGIIKNDNNIPQTRKEKLIDLSELGDIAPFLTEVFRYTIVQDNKFSNQEKSGKNKDDKTENYTRKIDIIEPPSNIEAHENLYIQELLNAYSDNEKAEIKDLENLKNFQKLYDNFIRQRKDYFSAESVRRGTRDMYAEDEEDQFEVFKEEVYDGVIDIWEEDYADGLVRLRSVLAQAVQVQMDRCLLAKNTDWIGNGQRKGACHMLVNDGRITGWRKKDE